MSQIGTPDSMIYMVVLLTPFSSKILPLSLFFVMIIGLNTACPFCFPLLQEAMGGTNLYMQPTDAARDAARNAAAAPNGGKTKTSPYPGLSWTFRLIIIYKNNFWKTRYLFISPVSPLHPQHQ